MKKEVKTVKVFWRALCMSVAVAGMVALAGSAFAATFSIKGKVTDTKGTALRYILVRVSGISIGSSDDTVVTDDKGEFVSSGLDNGTYEVCFEDYAGLYLPPSDNKTSRVNRIYVAECYDNVNSRLGSRETLVLVKDNATGIDAQLELGGSIAGKVTDKDGNPVKNVTVVAYEYFDYYGWYGFDYAYTKDNGTYIIEGLPMSAYIVAFDPSGAIGNFANEWYNNKSYSRDAENLLLATEGQAFTGIDAKLETAGSLSGKVTVGDNKTVEGIGVRLTDPQGAILFVTRTMLDGTYIFNNVRPDKYKVEFRPGEIAPDYSAEWYNDKISYAAADNLTVIQDNEIKNINAKLEKSGKITGSVKNFFRKPIPGAEIYIFDANAPFESLWGSYIDRASVDDNGTFEIEGLKPGDYKLFFYAETETGAPYKNEWWKNKAKFKKAKAITVTAGGTVDKIKAILSRWMRIF